MKAIQLELKNGRKYCVEYEYFINEKAYDRLENNEDKRLENEMKNYRMFKKFKTVDNDDIFLNVGEIVIIEVVNIADR